MKFDQQLSAETLPTKIYRILREAILNGQLKPGERLVQEELAKSFNVSRMPVREAVTQLAADGFVTIEPHKGAIVKEFSVHEIEELYFLRSKFEPLAAAESLHKLTASLLETLVMSSSLSPADKQSMTSALRELPAESIKHLTTKVVDAGWDSLPGLMILLQTFLFPPA